MQEFLSSMPHNATHFTYVRKVNRKEKGSKRAYGEDDEGHGEYEDDEGDKPIAKKSCNR
jgi:hypothetical protein